MSAANPHPKSALSPCFFSRFPAQRLTGPCDFRQRGLTLLLELSCQMALDEGGFAWEFSRGFSAFLGRCWILLRLSALTSASVAYEDELECWNLSGHGCRLRR